MFSVGLNAFSFTYMTLAFNKIVSVVVPDLWSLNLSAVFHLQYLLHYLLSVKSLVNRHAWSRTPVAETSWALLRDCYHGAMVICHRPQHIAIAMLYLALNSYGVELPAGEREWWKVCAEKCSYSLWRERANPKCVCPCSSERKNLCTVGGFITSRHHLIGS